MDYSHTSLPCPSPTPGACSKLMSIDSVMPSNHLIFCRPLFLPPSIFPSIRVFSNESVFHWRRQWHPTPVLLPGESHRQRSLVGCHPWGLKKSDTTERLHFHFSLSRIGEGNGNPLQCSCLENPRDGESLVGCHLWVCTESEMTEMT